MHYDHSSYINRNKVQLIIFQTSPEMEPPNSNPPTVRCAVVTGANKGIGLEISRQLASQGIMVILTARDEKRGAEAVANLNNSGLSNVVFHQLDVQDLVSITSLAKFVETQFGNLDILVNNAGDGGVSLDGEGLKALKISEESQLSRETINQLKKVMDQTYEKAIACLKTNYYGLKAVTEALIPLLELSDSPRIVNLSSSLGNLKWFANEEFKEKLKDLDGLIENKLHKLLESFLKDFKKDLLEINGWPPLFTAYSVSKAAVNAYTRILAKKFPNICINSVHPGSVKTDINCNTGPESVEDGAKGPVMLALLPVGGPSGLYFDKMEISSAFD